MNLEEFFELSLATIEKAGAMHLHAVTTLERAVFRDIDRQLEKEFPNMPQRPHVNSATYFSVDKGVVMVRVELPEEPFLLEFRNKGRLFTPSEIQEIRDYLNP